MTQLFDAYRDTYEDAVTSSISFAALPHDFFVSAKVEMLSELFTRHFGGRPKPSVLDVGCGVGRMHPLLLPHVRSLAGTDSSSASLARAQQENLGVDYLPSNGSRLPWKEHQFDCALAVCVLHHVPPSEWSAFIAEMRRVVRPGGLIVLVEHNPWNPLTRLAVFRCPFDKDAVLLGARKACELLDSAGCSAIESRHFLLLPWRRIAARRVERLLQKAALGAQFVASGTA